MSQLPLFQFGPMMQQLMGMFPGFMAQGSSPTFDGPTYGSWQAGQTNPNDWSGNYNPMLGNQGQKFNPLTQTWEAQPMSPGPSGGQAPQAPAINWGKTGGAKMAVDYKNNPGSFVGVYGKSSGSGGGYAGIY